MIGAIPPFSIRLHGWMLHQSIGTMFLSPLLVLHIFNERRASGWKIIKRVFNFPFIKLLNRLMIFTKLGMDIMPLRATPPFYVHYDFLLRVLLIRQTCKFPMHDPLAICTKLI